MMSNILTSNIISEKKSKNKTKRCVMKRQKSNVMSALLPHLMRIGVIFSNTIFGHMIFYRIVGVCNRMFGVMLPNGRPIKTIFTMYPTNIRYMRTIIYSWYAPFVKWSPVISKIMKQDNKFGIVFGITAMEKDFAGPEGRKNLKDLHDKMSKIKKAIGVEQMTFSGVLPSRFCSMKITSTDEPIERKNTVGIIQTVVNMVRKNEKVPIESPIIILGGDGFIGSMVSNRLRDSGFIGPIVSIDLGDDVEPVKKLFSGKPALILNITTRKALRNYLNFLWPEAIVINEVYPEPSKAVLKQMKTIGCACYHIVGVEGWAFPSFPYAYKDGLPCCASLDGKFNAKIKKL